MAMTRDQKNAACVHLGYLHFSVNTLLDTIKGLGRAGCLTPEQMESAIAGVIAQRGFVAMAMGEMADGDPEFISLLVDYGLLPPGYTVEKSQKDAEQALMKAVTPGMLN